MGSPSNFSSCHAAREKSANQGTGSDFPHLFDESPVAKFRALDEDVFSRSF
jgi:hypothetical protein